jgi:hypothetical protein
MRLNQLLTFFEDYYGEKYSGAFLTTMCAYLDGHKSEFYEAAASVIVMRFSRAYNKVPDPAVIEKHMDEILAAMPKPKLLSKPEEPKATPEEYEMYMAALKDAYHHKKPNRKKILVQEGGNYCMRTVKELSELRKDGGYNGVVINRLGGK